MLVRIQNFANAILKANKESLTKTDTEPTKWSWAKKIRSYEEVPDTYKSFFQPLLESGQAFPYTLLTPSFNQFIVKSNEKLICDLGDELIVFDKIGNTFEEQHYPIDRISHFEVRSVLLNSQIKLYGLSEDGTSISSSLKFNSVTDYLFEPILKKIRLTHIDSQNLSQAPKSGAFDHLMNENFKFMNYARQSILDGEKVTHFILQPEIKTNILKLFGITYYYKTIHPTHMVILTDWELITIREEKVGSDSGKYGGTWNFIPLSKIKDISTSMKDENLLMLSIQISGADSLEVPFEVSAQEEVDQLLARFEELTKK